MKVSYLVPAIFLALAGASCARSDVPAPALDASLASRVHLTPNRHTAKNVILFIGDGMGVSTVTATRIYDGQLKGQPGEENVLPFETFPNLALVKTYNTNQQVGDSAGTGTAMETGVKTRAGVIDVAPEADREDCRAALRLPLASMGELAEQNGKATGVVTTTRITHATPATVYAHSAERDWESDRFMSAADWDAGCRDIAWQLAHFDVGDGLDVVLGGGRIEFFGAAGGGERKTPDDDLVKDWLDGGPGRVFVSSAAELESVPPGHQVFGLFSDDHMTYMTERPADSTEPTLSQMTSIAIDLLAAKGNGYYLMVEGGRIDHGHHDGKAGYALAEAEEFARAVEVALEKVDLDETLVLVTADHSHTMAIVGYPVRGNPILGLVTNNDRHGHPEPQPALAADGKPYTTLGYVNGRGAVGGGERPVPETGLYAKQQSLYATVSVDLDGSRSEDETHGGEDVALYAIGPWSQLVGGVLEQNVIFHVMTYAFGWTEKQKHLKEVNR